MAEDAGHRVASMMTAEPAGGSRSQRHHSRM
jgi:hypothetical protein